MGEEQRTTMKTYVLLAISLYGISAYHSHKSIAHHAAHLVVKSITHVKPTLVIPEA